MNEQHERAVGVEEPTTRGLAQEAATAFAAYRAWDPHPLGDLVRAVSPLLWHTVRAAGIEREEAEDVVQGVWLSLVRSADTIREPDAVLQWLLVTARRSAWDVVRRRREEQRRRAGADVDLSAFASTEAQPEEPVLEAERDRTLWLRFRQLPARCQEILRMVAMADRPDYRAIALATGMPLGSVGVTRGRCLAKLRTLLQDDETWVHA